MKNRVRFRTRLALLVLATALPFVAFIGHMVLADAREQADGAAQAVDQTARRVARDAEARIERARAHLSRLAQRTASRALDPESCDPLIGELVALFPEYAGIATTRMDGTVVCRVLRVPVTRALPGRLPEAVTPDFHVGPVWRGSFSGRWVVRLSLPLQGARGGQLGAMYVTLDMAYLAPDRGLLEQAREATACIADGGGIVVAGVQLPSGALGRAIDEVDECAARAARFRSTAPVGGTGWTAVVQLPADAVVGPAERRLQSGIAFSLAVLALAGVLAYLTARRTLVPVEAIAAAVRRAADDDQADDLLPSASAMRGAPMEIFDLADDFGRMLKARAAAEHARRADEARLQAVIEHLDEGIDIFDGRGRVLRRNPAAQRIFPAGVDPGSRFEDLQAAFELRTPDGRILPVSDWPVPRLLRGESVRAEEVQVLYRPQQRTTILRISGALVRDPRGESMMFAAYVDITEARRREQEREALEARVRESQKMESIGTLAGGIAHDFNNILAAILGNVLLARADLQDDHPALASLDQINRAGLRARNLVQQILAFSRRQPLGLEPQALQPLVRETMALLRATLPAQVEFELQLAEEPVRINANATQVQQVLMNLCTNAWHAMEDRPGRVQIGVERVVLDAAGARQLGLQPGPHAHLWVRDEGVGMDEATRAHIFEPFFTTKPRGHGTGLGLPVVHGIAISHGGGIAVESEPGRGSTFRLFLPALSGDAPLREEGERSAAAVRGQGERVLYVDDDEVMVLMVERLLVRAGFRARCFHRPVEALAALEVAPGEVDVVVSDLNMPEISGLDVARAVHRIDPALPVVISSGFLSDELRAKLEDAGVAGMLQKEHTLEDLLPTLVRVLAAATVR